MKLLCWIHRHPGWAWTILIAYAIAVTFPHETVQYYVNEIALRISHRRLYQVSAGIGIAEAALLSGFVLWRTKDRVIGTYWILTIVLIIGTWRLLTANNVELVHYPQYVPEGMLLLALTLSPLEAIAWVTIFGGLDECYQYWHLMAGKPVEYDLNDIFMDLLGGAAGVLIAMAILRCDRRAPVPWRDVLRRPGVVALGAVALITIALILTGQVLLYEDKSNTHYWFALSRDKPPTYFFINPMFGPHKFHTLSPIEGPMLIVAVLGIYAMLDRRVRVFAK